MESQSPFTDADLGTDRQLYGDLIDHEPGDTPWIVSPRLECDDQALILKALQVLDIADASLAREVCGLIVQVVQASSLIVTMHVFGRIHAERRAL